MTGPAPSGMTCDYASRLPISPAILREIRVADAISVRPMRTLNRFRADTPCPIDPRHRTPGAVTRSPLILKYAIRMPSAPTPGAGSRTSPGVSLAAFWRHREVDVGRGHDAAPTALCCQPIIRCRQGHVRFSRK
jgi:hypothetical protein